MRAPTWEVKTPGTLELQDGHPLLEVRLTGDSWYEVQTAFLDLLTVCGIDPTRASGHPKS